MDERQFEVLSRKMDMLIKLTAMNAVAGKNLSDQVSLLSSLSFRPSEIGEILVKPTNVITATLSNLHKKRAGKS